MNINLSSRFLLLVTLDTLIQLLHQTGGQLRESTLRRTVTRVPWCSSSFDTASDRVENVTSDTSLFSHDIHRHLGA